MNKHIKIKSKKINKIIVKLSFVKKIDIYLDERYWLFGYIDPLSNFN